MDGELKSLQDIKEPKERPRQVPWKNQQLDQLDLLQFFTKTSPVDARHITSTAVLLPFVS